MRMEKNDIRQKQDVGKHISARAIIFCICMMVLVCMAGKGRNVQAAGYDYPVEKTKEVQVLDAECRDSQGVKYTLDEVKNTAMIGNYAGGLINTSGYQKTDDGVCIIPEKVSYQGKEYTVTTLDRDVFSSNETIRVLVLPDTITELKSPYIWSNMQTQYLYVGKGLNLTQCSMENCSNLREVAVSEDNPYVKNVDDVIYSKDGKTLLYNPPMREGSTLGEYQVLEGTEVIAEKAFRESRYRNITLPDSVKEIGFEAFAFCSWLRTMDLSRVEKIDGFLFCGGDYSLQSIKFPDNDYTMGMDIGDQYMPMRAVMLTKGLHVSNFESSSFEKMQYLECAAVQDGVTTLGEREFRACGRLRMVLLPDTLQSLPDQCLSECSSLEKLYIPPSVTSIGKDVLAECSSIVIYGEEGSAAEDYALEHGFSFEDVSSHDHEHLSDTVVYEDPYMKITAKYCTECGYAKDIAQEMKDGSPDADITNGVYDMQLEKTREKVVLGRNMTDTQGVVYSIAKQTQTASVVRTENQEDQTSIVIPEIVVKDGVEYVVDQVKNKAFASNDHVISITLCDTIQTLGEDGALASESLKYVYIGEGVINMLGTVFPHDSAIRGIWISPGNSLYYVKDHTVYQCNCNGERDFMVYEYTPENTTPSDDPERDDGKKDDPSNGETGDSDKKDPNASDSGSSGSDTSQGSTSGEETSQQPDNQPDAGTGGTEPGNTGNPTGDGQTTDGSGSVLGTNANGTSASENLNHLKPDLEPDDSKRNSGENKANDLPEPKLKVTKKCTSDGVHYLQLDMKKLSGKYIELYVQKGNGKYKKIKLRSSRIKKKSLQLKIGYKPDGKKMRVKVRTYTKAKGKKKYSGWSKPITVK